VGFVMSQLPPVASHPVIQALEIVRERVTRRLMEAPEYRALLAVENAIAEVAAIGDLIVHLETARQEILDRLTTTSAAYRALLTVKKAIKDISEIPDIGGSDTDFDSTPAAPETAFAEEAAITLASVAIEPAAAMEEQQTAAAIVATAPPGDAPVAVATEVAEATGMPNAYAFDASTDLAGAVEASRAHPEASISNAAERLSTFRFVEAWRLSALGESYLANLRHKEPLPPRVKRKASAGLAPTDTCFRDKPDVP
jgi:hypothetical protein